MVRITLERVVLPVLPLLLLSFLLLAMSAGPLCEIAQFARYVLARRNGGPVADTAEPWGRIDVFRMDGARVPRFVRHQRLQWNESQ